MERINPECKNGAQRNFCIGYLRIFKIMQKFRSVSLRFIFALPLIFINPECKNGAQRNFCIGYLRIFKIMQKFRCVSLRFIFALRKQFSILRTPRTKRSTDGQSEAEYSYN